MTNTSNLQPSRVFTRPMNEVYLGMVANLNTVRNGRIRFCNFPAIADEDIAVGVPVFKLKEKKLDDFPYYVTQGKKDAERGDLVGISYANLQIPFKSYLFDPNGKRLDEASKPNFPNPTSGNQNNYRMFYQKGQDVSLLEEGEIIMLSETPVGHLQRVFCRIEPDAGKKEFIGAVSNQAGDGLTELKGARFIGEYLKPGLVWVRFHLDSVDAPSAPSPQNTDPVRPGRKVNTEPMSLDSSSSIQPLTPVDVTQKEDKSPIDLLPNKTDDSVKQDDPVMDTSWSDPE